MGIWSEPCIKTEYAISDLASEFSGQFIFAKIDIDEQEELKQQFVQSHPYITWIR
jgi:putative thioredoxin